jgi:outer membrane protein OmpA-like peptidoglycan-associated protein
MMRRSALTLALVLTAPTALLAQIGRGGQVELGAFGSYTRFDPTHIGIDAAFGGGGWLGFHLSRAFSLEFSGNYLQTKDTVATNQVNVASVSGALLYNVPLSGDNALYIGAGYQRNFYRSALVGDESAGVGILGDRLPLGGRAALRIEGRAAYTPTSMLRGVSQKALNLSVRAGISIFAFGGPPRDADGDGVPDSRDRCPATPLGASVDRNGCPTDSDGDHVYDGLDQCPNTPAGATVDAKGCPSDADHDGVVDGIDQCPNTPAGATVDAKGCPTDSDKDGVLDGIDQCPNTPAGATVDAKGCPTDSDKDGVFDGIDQCPGTPAGAQVDARGCVVHHDQDNDGVPDSMDKCPNTRPGQQVDAVGCPILFKVEAGKPVAPLILKGVNFKTNSSRLTPESYAVLDQVAASLVAHPEVRIEISGHTDATGSHKHNMELSLARAISVRTYLASKGVAPGRMVAKGYGPDRPIATNRTAAGRAQNRRVELQLIQTP